VGADAPVLTLTAANIAFDTHDLEVAAGTPFKIELTNNDAVEHNVGIYQGQDEIFRGDAVTGPGQKVTYVIDALEAGEYTFMCDFHPGPAMTGTLTVK
jgi:plastocyanin